MRLPELDEAAVQGEAVSLLNDSVEELVLQRKREGDRLSQLISERLVSAELSVAGVQEVLPEISVAIRQRLETRLTESSQQIDQNRLEQEIVFHLTKQDVEEEMDRLKLHLREVKQVLSAKDPVGRRLDFLMQELNREANTLGSKSVDARTTDASVELKVLIEQMREQVQNLE